MATSEIREYSPPERENNLFTVPMTGGGWSVTNSRDQRVYWMWKRNWSQPRWQYRCCVQASALISCFDEILTSKSIQVENLEGAEHRVIQDDNTPPKMWSMWKSILCSYVDICASYLIWNSNTFDFSIWFFHFYTKAFFCLKGSDYVL